MPIRLFVAGSTTMVGRALVRQLESDPDVQLVGLADEEPRLTDPAAVDRFFAATRPDRVLIVGGKQAGIAGNQRYPADLMIDNLLIAASVIPAASQHGTKKLLYLASSCTYPKHAPQPFQPDALWTGPVEPTSAAYAVAKLAGMTLADAYRRQQHHAFVSAIAADAYGPDDDFSLDNSHVVGALMRRMHEARESGAPAVDIWGTGTPRREFIFVDDLADACLFVMRAYDGEAPINLGTGTTTSIAELASLIRDVVGYRGELRFDTTRPDGMPLKGLASGVLHGLGWQPKWPLAAGLERTYRGFVELGLGRHRS
jgi:GDP-L-fucose synthase